MRLPSPSILRDQDVIAAIKRQHLQANIAGIPKRRQYWRGAWVDAGGTLYGPGPYVKLPLSGLCSVVIRVYAPARLRRHLAKHWKPEAR